MLRNRTERERICAVSVFALIFASLAGGVDFVVTGGPDLIPGAAEASTLSASPSLVATSPAPAPQETALAEADFTELTVTEIGYGLSVDDLLGGPEAALDELPALAPAPLLAEVSDVAVPAPAKGKPAGI